MSLIRTKREGIFKNTQTGKFLARITINGKQFKRTFDTEFQAIRWRVAIEGGEIPEVKKDADTSTLKYVWSLMREKHFPLLAKSTRVIWERRYEALKDLENFPMGEITPSKVSAWVEAKVKETKDDESNTLRCNFDNELNLLVTIFNWYRTNEQFEEEARLLTCPVNPKHKKLGFVRPKPIKDKAITLEAAMLFFESLRPLYRDLALFQFYTASRIGEAAGLQWHRVDFQNNRITIMETCYWNSDKVFESLNEYPKNKEPRPVYMTKELREVLERRLAFKDPCSNFVFHVDGKPLNYGTIQLNYREAQRKSRIPYTGTHILRHGMAKLARRIGGGLDAVIAMTGHKDFKLADHYSKLDLEYQKEVSEKIMSEISLSKAQDMDNVVKFKKRKA